MTEKKELQVSSLDSIKKQASPKVVSLPGWIQGEVFNARLKRPSLLYLSSKGLIPNSLLGAAEEVFTGVKNSKNGPSLKDIGEVMNVLVESALVEPTVAQLTEIEVQLTDDQITEIFSYTQKGVVELKTFRTEHDSIENNSSSEK